MARHGWVRQPGKAERYRPPVAERARLAREGKLSADGTTSRRQYENERSREAGWSSWSEYQRTARRDDFYIRSRADAISDQGESRRTTGATSEFARLYNEQRRVRKTDPDLWHDPEGPMADFLVYIGIRNPEWEFDVGDTPDTAQLAKAA